MVEETTPAPRSMPDWVALMLINTASLGVVVALLLVGVAIDHVFFDG